MATELVMPKLGIKMIEWKKKEGERVEKEESICLIKTMKVLSGR